MKRILDGKEVELTQDEMDVVAAQEAIDSAPPTPSEIDAAIDRLIDRKGGTEYIAALERRVFLLEKAAKPSLTPAQFRKSIHDEMKGL